MPETTTGSGSGTAPGSSTDAEPTREIERGGERSSLVTTKRSARGPELERLSTQCLRLEVALRALIVLLAFRHQEHDRTDAAECRLCQEIARARSVLADQDGCDG